MKVANYSNRKKCIDIPQVNIYAELKYPYPWAVKSETKKEPTKIAKEKKK